MESKPAQCLRSLEIPLNKVQYDKDDKRLSIDMGDCTFVSHYKPSAKICLVLDDVYNTLGEVKVARNDLCFIDPVTVKPIPETMKIKDLKLQEEEDKKGIEKKKKAEEIEQSLKSVDELIHQDKISQAVKKLKSISQTASSYQLTDLSKRIEEKLKECYNIEETKSVESKAKSQEKAKKSSRTNAPKPQKKAKMDEGASFGAVAKDQSVMYSRESDERKSWSTASELSSKPSIPSSPSPPMGAPADYSSPPMSRSRDFDKVEMRKEAARPIMMKEEEAAPSEMKEEAEEAAPSDEMMLEDKKVSIDDLDTGSASMNGPVKPAQSYNINMGLQYYTVMMEKQSYLFYVYLSHKELRIADEEGKTVYKTSFTIVTTKEEPPHLEIKVNGEGFEVHPYKGEVIVGKQDVNPPVMIFSVLATKSKTKRTKEEKKVGQKRFLHVYVDFEGNTVSHTILSIIIQPKHYHVDVGPLHMDISKKAAAMASILSILISIGSFVYSAFNLGKDISATSTLGGLIPGFASLSFIIGLFVSLVRGVYPIKEKFSALLNMNKVGSIIK